MRSFIAILAAIAGVMLAFNSSIFAADNFPNRPITLLVGYPPGGVAGNSARSVATGAEKALGQPMVILNKAGAGGTLAVDYVVAAKPDGYTLINAATSTICYAMFTEGVTWGPKDFTQIIGYTYPNYAIVSSVEAPFKNYDEWVNYVRSHPGFKYGTYGAMGTLHILMEWIAKKENLKMDPVHFKGDAPAVTALLGGHIQVHGCSGSHAAQIKAGKLRTLLQVSGIPSDPDPESIPRLAGKYPDCPQQVFNLPFGVFGPKGIPDDIRKKLTAAFRAGAQDPSCPRALSALSMSVELNEPEKLRQDLEKGFDEFSKLVKVLGLKRE